MCVAEHLYLDMARALHVFFYQHRVVAKAVDGLALAGCQRGIEVLGLVHRAHALAATPGAGLDQHRVTDAAGLGLEQHRVLVGGVVTGHQWYAGLFHQLLGFGLETHGLDGRRWRADKDQPGIGAGLRKSLVFAQKAITRVDRLGACGLGRLQDFLPAQVAVLGRAAANMHRLVAGHHVFGAGVGVGIHRHRLDAQAPRRCRNAAGDLAAIGNQNLVEHTTSSIDYFRAPRAGRIASTGASRTVRCINASWTRPYRTTPADGG